MRRSRMFARILAGSLAALVFAVVVMAPLVAGASGSYYVTKWGTTGGANGQFRDAHNVAVDADGYVYVCDLSNNRIQKFTSSGTYVTKWGSSGSGNGQFDEPRGISVDADGYVWVADSGNSRVQKFTSTGTYLMKFGSYGTSNGRFRTPHSIAFDTAGAVYVSDTQNNRIQKFTSAGAYVSQLGNSGATETRLSWPKDLVIDASGDIVVCDAGKDRVTKLTTGGTYVSSFGSEGSGDGQFRDAHGIALGDAGNIFVSDGENNNVQAFDSSGTFLHGWGSAGTANGQFNEPTGLATAGDYVYVADEDNDRVQVFGFDEMAPVTVSDAPAGWQKADVDVTLTATDGGSGVASTNYNLNASGWTLYPGSAVTVSEEGTNTLAYYSVDVAGNTETATADTILIDKSAPVTTTDAPGGWAVAPFAVSFEATDTYSGVATTEFSLNGAGWETYSGPIDVTSDGEWVFDYRSTDNAGNAEETATATVRLDMTAPDVTVAGVSDGGLYNTSVTPTASTTDPSAEITATLDGQPFVLGTPVTDEGAYTLVVTCTDQAGNATIETISFVIDKTPPALTIVGVTDGAVYTAAVHPDATCTDPTAKVTARLNGSACGLGDPVSAEGSYTFQVTATDDAGNSATKAVAFSIATLVPVARSGAPSPVGAAVLFSKGAWSTSSVVVLARADVYADSLAAAGLAGSYGAPVLLTSSTSLSSASKEEITRLKAKKVFVVGGTTAIKPAVVTSLKRMGVSVERIAGDNRYELSVAIGKRIKKHDGSRFSRYVIVASGRSWKSTLGLSALAYQLKAPVVFVTKNTYRSDVKRFIAAGKFKTMIVAGSTANVSAKVSRALARAGKSTAIRAGGTSRYDCGESAARLAYGHSKARAAKIGLISGAGWTYANTAGPAAAKVGGLMLLTDPNRLSYQTGRFLGDVAPAVTSITLMGDGTTPRQAVADQALDVLER